MKRKIYTKTFAFLAFLLLVTNVYALNNVDIGNYFNDGAGFTSTNIDDNPKPDYFIAWVDAAINGSDTIYYKVAKNVDKNFANEEWGQTYRVYSPGSKTEGLGIAIGDINRNGKSDIIFVSIDNPDGENNIRYKIGWDLDEDGAVSANWSSRKTIYSDKVHVGGSTDGAGVGLWDIDKNGVLDLLVAWADNPSGDNTLYYVIFWNLDENGDYESISERIALPSGHYTTMEGVGVELTNLDEDPAPEFVYAFIDGIMSNNVIIYNVGWNLDGEGKTSSWSGFDARINYDNSNDGMGVAVDRVDGDYTADLTFLWIDDPITQNTIKFQHLANFKKSDSQGIFKDIKTPARSELLTHAGKVISVSLDRDKKAFTYTVMNDDGSWSNLAKLPLPNMARDESVENIVKDAPFNYVYDTADVEVKSFHLLSDGQYLYLFRASSDGFLYADRFILDIATNELLQPYDIRYKRSGKKCEPAADVSDTLGYEDMDKNAFYEPSVKIWELKNQGVEVKDFSVVIVPTGLPNEERWQIFALGEDTRAALYSLSFRRAIEDACVKEKNRVYFNGYFYDADQVLSYSDENNAKQEVTIRGKINDSFSAADIGYDGDWFVYGPSATLYANQQSCDGQIIKRGQRLKVIVPANGTNTHMVDIDFGINGLGELLDIDLDKNSYSDSACDKSVASYSYVNRLGETSDGVPFVFESSDGFLHLLYKHVNYQVSMAYDTLSDKWMKNNSPDVEDIAGGVGEWWTHDIQRATYARIPWLYYPQPLDEDGITATATEYGFYGYNSDGVLVGVMMRAFTFVRDTKVYFISEKVGDLELRYIGQNLIDPTLIGYIEGAPPVPRENLTLNNDYEGITSVEMLSADSVTQEYVQSKDRGLNFEMDGSTLGAAFSIESSYSWLSENSNSYESVTSISMSQSLKGRWNDETNQWEPDNIGVALIKAKKADIYGLYFQGSDRLYSYKSIPLEGSEEEYLTSFVINPKYVKNGTLDGRVGSHLDEDWEDLEATEKGSYYKEDELEALERQIKQKEEDIRSYYAQYSSSAFSDIPSLESISKRNIVNEYDWAATGGYRSKSLSYATSVAESIGGSFNFQGMAGVALGDPIWGTFELNVLAGAHIEKAFTKNQESTSSFELAVEANIEGKEILDSQLNNIDSNSSKVDYYKWKTLYLEPSKENFDDFYDRVVDPKWLSGDNVYAERLREARNRSNKVWRIRHFVTFVSRTYEVSDD